MNNILFLLDINNRYIIDTFIHCCLLVYAGSYSHAYDIYGTYIAGSLFMLVVIAFGCSYTNPNQMCM